MSGRDDGFSRAEGRQAAGDAPPSHSHSHSHSWSELAAGAGCPESLGAVAQVDPSTLSGAALVDAIVASEKALSLLAARQMGLLTEFARPGRAGDVSELVAELMDKGGQGRRPDGEIDLDTVETLVQERAASLAAAEVAAALQISPITAGSRVRKAQELCDGLPATVNALAAGRIDRGRAWLIAERTAPLSPSLREAVQDRILPIAEDRSAGNLRSLLDRAVIAADPHAAENRERKAKRDRELVLRSLPDGMASVRANAPADAAMSIFTLADLLADRTGADDDRPVAARRVDAWHDIADQLLTHGYVDLTDLLDQPEGCGEQVSTQGISKPEDQLEADTNDAHTSPSCASNPVPDPASGAADDDDNNNSDDDNDATPSTPSPDSPVVGETGTSRTSASDTTSHSSEAATPPAAQRLQCAICGGHQPDTLPASTTGNREQRRSTRRAARQGRRPHLTVTLSASTLAGLDRLPGHLEGYGAITAETALMIARSAATVTTVLLDPASGSIIGTGSRTYRPSQATRDITTTLATTCRFPSCRQPAWRCDLDHRDPFDHPHPDDGGRTDPANLDPLCRAHHWLKHHTGWSSSRGPDHTQIWSSPTGHRYTDPPRTLTLPGELLVPTEVPSAHLPDDRNAPQIDDEGLRADWRDAEFGGPFPDTAALKVLVTTVRGRIEQVRDLVRAPRAERFADRHHGRLSDAPPDAPPDVRPDVRPVDPDEPPF